MSHNPTGDAGSSQVPWALHLYDTTGKKVNGMDPISRPQHRRSLFVKKALASLKKGEIFGIAMVEQSLVLRALGNRSPCSGSQEDQSPRRNECN